MTRLFGCICNQPQRLLQAVEPLRHVLCASAPVPRFGLGYIQSGEVLLSVDPRGSDEELDFIERLQDLRTDGYVVGHAALDDGLAGNENTQPFRYRQWLYAQEYTSTLGESERERLAAELPAFLRRRIRGKTPAEYVFHMFLAELHTAKLIDVHDIPPRALRDILATVLARVGDHTRTQAGLDNLILSNGRSLLAVRLELPLSMRRLTVEGEPRRAHGFRGVLMVSRASADEPGFEEIPKNSLLFSHRDIRTEVLPLLG